MQKKSNNISGFTLAEIIMVLTILGLVAVITVPTVLSKTGERERKTKIRKAMAAYETAIEKIIVENGIPRNQEALINFISANNCANASSYFNISHTETPDSKCRFQAPDKLWWDVTDITNTIVSFKDTDLDDFIASGDEYKAFKFVSAFDSNGSIRINDKVYGEFTKNTITSYKAGTIYVYPEAVNKTEAYLNNEKYTGNIYVKFRRQCTAGIKTECTDYGKWDPNTGWPGCYSPAFNENGQAVGCLMDCPSANAQNCKKRKDYNYYPNGGMKDNLTYCNMTMTHCDDIGFGASNPTTNGWYGGHDCSIDMNNKVAICKSLSGGRTKLCADNESIVPCPDNPAKNCYSFKFYQDDYKLVNDLWAPKS